MTSRTYLNGTALSRLNEHIKTTAQTASTETSRKGHKTLAPLSIFSAITLRNIEDPSNSTRAWYRVAAVTTAMLNVRSLTLTDLLFLLVVRCMRYGSSTRQECLSNSVFVFASSSKFVFALTRAADRTVYGYGRTLYGLYTAISVPSSVPYASTSVTLTVRYVV